ncbi:hypothetical protein BTHE68_63470 (plasmid) [Burkholderia sp. THE68]|uniref:DUF4011 domain-containing protein n=1 Tax=Burkholderia sp. THE68 TaxID=758782 RepID=UPI0013186094|nr:DUF4011 domain-containing protein [Burkholderia sp. THE68]BBU32613.1 hypothetical protein BTHE68_63470 [Burkholderia sp. THE68]
MDDQNKHNNEPASASRVNWGSIPIEEALQQLRLRLLDLTARDRLLSFKPTAGKSLQFVQCSPEAVFSRLVDAPNSATVTLTGVPEPERAAWAIKNGRLTRPDVRDYAPSAGIPVTYELGRANTKLPATATSGAQMRALFYADDLPLHCRKLEREAKLAMFRCGGTSKAASM